MPFPDADGFQSDRQDWETPPVLFNALDAEFHFTLDVCARPDNTKCPAFFTEADNGLTQDWGKGICWCNPPYNGAVGAWLEKAHDAVSKGATVVLLVFARTDSKWFHTYLYQKPNVELRFLKGRVRFVGGKHSAPSPSLIAILRPDKS